MGFINLKDIVENEPVPGFNGKFIHSKHITVVHWKIKKGSVMPEHSHHHEQVTNIIEGEFELEMAGKTKKLGSGEIGVFPSNIKHKGRALTDCYIIDVFYPVRDDYKIE